MSYNGWPRDLDNLLCDLVFFSFPVISNIQFAFFSTTELICLCTTTKPSVLCDNYQFKCSILPNLQLKLSKKIKVPINTITTQKDTVVSGLKMSQNLSCPFLYFTRRWWHRAPFPIIPRTRGSMHNSSTCR